MYNHNTLQLLLCIILTHYKGTKNSPYKYKFKIQFDALQPLEIHVMIILHC